MAANRAWIEKAMTEGAQICDIGPDFARGAQRLKEGVKPYSDFYNMERTVTKWYDNYIKMWTRPR